jgi:uncharacterized membrane protein YheB (UPF0754 family)
VAKMMTQWIFMVIIGGLIGWFTNMLAIRLLFRPYEPIKIPVIGVSLQGLIPLRKAELARSVGEQIEKELLSMDDIMRAFDNPDQKSELKVFLRLYLNDMILEKIPAFVRNAMKKPSAIL